MLAVAVKHQHRLFRREQTGADAPFTGLAPALERLASAAQTLMLVSSRIIPSYRFVKFG